MTLSFDVEQALVQALRAITTYYTAKARAIELSHAPDSKNRLSE